MTDIQIAVAVGALVALAILYFVPIVRQIVAVLARIAITVAATLIAIFGLALLMNNETVYERPGVRARTLRFLTVHSAATSEEGLGSATCKWADEPQPAGTGVSETAALPGHRTGTPEKPERRVAQPAAAATGTAAAIVEEAETEDDVYPELVRRGYPGIPRAQLFKLAEETVKSLGGWRILKSDRRRYKIDCMYTTRMFGWQDDVRIEITRQGEIDLCARSRTSLPGSNSMLRFFPGDLGANTGHIKQFYEAMGPRVDAYYDELAKKQNAARKRK